MTFNPGAGLRNFFKDICLLILGYKPKFSENLRQAKKQHIKAKFWNGGP